MKHLHFFTFAFSLALFFTGCWTVKESDHPPVAVTALPAGKEIRAQVAGFDATYISYDTAYSYSTVSGWSGPWYGRRGWHGGGFGTAVSTTTSYIPRAERTNAYRNRAVDVLEQAGFLLKTNDPQYQIEVTFAGPFSEDGDGWAKFGWLVCTLFTADYDGATWQAKLRVRDLKSGKLLYAKDIAERDEAVVWGPIPLFSPAGSDRTSEVTMKHICLAALTDKAVAEAVAFLSGL